MCEGGQLDAATEGFCFAVVPFQSLWTEAASSFGMPAGGYVVPPATAGTSTMIVIGFPAKNAGNPITIMEPDPLFSAEPAMGLRPALDG